MNWKVKLFTEAFASGWIDQPEVWDAMIEDRNLTSHTYQERTAEAVYAAIRENYFPNSSYCLSAWWRRSGKLIQLPEKIRLKLIAQFAEEHTVEQVKLFGSRARGESRPNSDIDLALVGKQIPLSLHTRLREAAGLYPLDLVRVDELDNELLRANIEQEGVVIYQREREA